MSMLKRYRKKGGFKQLLCLLETCAPKKCEQLLNLIKVEDSHWHQILSEKMISIEKIYSWDSSIITEIVTILPIRTMAIALKGAPEGSFEKTCECLTHFKRRELEELFKDLKAGPGEILAAQIKFVEKVRELADNGILVFERFAPELVIDEREVA